ncbi:transglycosylase domain-containing protein [Actinoplanes sp. NPDC089786]|uniref:transglycosylase domain-containing protein n=1 Tax=Actinoplanes sp. NPDC089786 TaxID=3155185 RepID=UPI00344926F3
MRALARLGGLLILVTVLSVAAAVPVGLAARAVTRVRRPSLPQQVLDPVTDQVTRVYAADGHTLIATFYDEDRHDVALAAIAPVMRQAIVAAEDARFYQHGGVDPRGVLRALVADAGSGHAGQGASTLTMQLVRNALKDDPALTPAERASATADTAARKLREAEYAVELEQQLSKQQILENYLNIAYFGDGAYGIDAAARRFFGVSPAKLTLAQSALIAGVLQSPDSDNPVTGDRAQARSRQLYVLAAMVRAGMITQTQATAAAARKLTFTGTARASGCTDFFCDYLQRWWAAQPRLGNLRTGGYSIVTTLDPAVQKAASAQARTVYSNGNRKALPIAVVQPGTGHVLALAVNRRFGTAKGETVDPLISGGGGVHGYPSGSTFKLFTMLAALQAGMPLNTGFDAPARLVTPWSDDGPGNCGGRYCPGNGNPAWMDGPRTMWNAFGRSVNTYFVHLEEQVGPAAAVAQAKNLGISFSAPADARLAAAPDGWGSFTLGVADTTPLELASAYATIAADGKYCPPTPVSSITDARGAKVPVADDCRQALPPDVARAAADAARCPVGEQSAWHQCDGGTAPQVAGIFDGHPVAGKTGSTEDNATETFVGFTPAVVAAGIANDPRDPSDHVGHAVESRVVTAVARTLHTAARDSGYPSFIPPSPSLAFG